MATTLTPAPDVSIRARIIGGEIKLLVSWVNAFANGAVKAKVDVTDSLGNVLSAQQLYFDDAGSPLPAGSHCLELPAPGTGTLNPDTEYFVTTAAFDSLTAPINTETSSLLIVKTPRLPVNPVLSVPTPSFSIVHGRKKAIHVDAQEPAGTPLNNVLTRFSLKDGLAGRLSTADTLESSSVETISNLSKESVVYHAPNSAVGLVELKVEVPGGGSTATATIQITVT